MKIDDKYQNGEINTIDVINDDREYTQMRITTDRVTRSKEYRKGWDPYNTKSRLRWTRRKTR